MSRDWRLYLQDKVPILENAVRGFLKTLPGDEVI